MRTELQNCITMDWALAEMQCRNEQKGIDPTWLKADRLRNLRAIERASMRPQALNVPRWPTTEEGWNAFAGHMNTI